MIPEIRTYLPDIPKDKVILVENTMEMDSAKLAPRIFGKMISEMEL